MQKIASSSIQVIDRAAALLSAIGDHPDPVSLKALAAETGLHPSTAHRILDALVTHGYVERAVSNQYTLGKTLLRFASRVHGKVDLLREAKAIRPDLPVALASGYVTPELESEAKAQGADALIYKPNDVNELCETVERLILTSARHAR